MARISGLMFAVLLVAATAGAQDWRGTGVLAGRVVDEQKKPIEGVIVRASYPGVVGALETKTDKRGEWSINDVAEGTWQLTFDAEGYVATDGSADVDESGRAPAVRTTMKKAFDPNAFIQEQVKKAEELMNQKKYAEARAVYEAVIEKVPDVAGPMQQYLARTYYAEGKLDQAVKHLRDGLAKEPDSPQAKLLLASMLAQTGNTEEASRISDTIGDANIPNAEIYLNLGLALMNQKKPTEAIAYLDKAATRFPQTPETYYYRANAYIELVNAEKDPKNQTRIDQIARVKADLLKFLQLAPNAPEAPHVKKLLEQIEKMQAEGK